MIRIRRSRAPAPAHSIVAVACSLFLTILCLGSPAKAAWQISVNGIDVTGLAAPIEVAGTPCVNPSSVAANLGLSVKIDSETLRITDSMGVQWRCAAGDLSLSAPGRMLIMPAPCTLSRGQIYVPLQVLACLAGLSYEADPQRQIASIVSSPPPALAPPAEAPAPAPAPVAPPELGDAAVTAADVPDGWSPLDLAKTPAELAEPSGFIEYSGRLGSLRAPAAAPVVVAQGQDAPHPTQVVRLPEPAPLGTTAAAAPAPQTASAPPERVQQATAVTHTTIQRQVPALVAAGDFAPDGWGEISAPKTAAELAEMKPASGLLLSFNPVRSGRNLVPPRFDTLRLSLGVGYVQGYDMGTTVTGAGKFMGRNVNFNTLLTEGPQGIKPEFGEVEVTDAEQRHEIDGGMLPSDLWGDAAGLRYSMVGKSGNVSSFSLYSAEGESLGHPQVVSVRSEYWPLRSMHVTGELASDGSVVVHDNFRVGPLLLNTNADRLAETSEFDAGVFGSVPFFRLANLSGGLSQSGLPSNRSRYQTYAAQIPIAHAFAINVGNTSTRDNLTRGSENSVGLSLPFNGVTATTNFQWGTYGNQPYGATTPVINHNQSLSASLGLPVTNRARLNIQSSTRWQPGQGPITCENVNSYLRFGANTTLSVSSNIPQVSASDALRVTLNQILDPSRSVSLTYGSLSPYQNENVATGSMGFQVMFNQSLDVRTRGVGGTISGRVTNLLGRPLKDVRVYLGPYSIYTPEDGKYEFKDVPSGEYQLGVDDNSLPATYKSCCASQTIIVNDRTRIKSDFQLIPLGTVSGRVFNDRNGDGRYAEGEGVGGVVLKLGDQVTISDPDGKYGFYNVDPGKYELSASASAIPGNLVQADPNKTVDIRADQALTGVDIRLKFQDKPVVYQELQ